MNMPRTTLQEAPAFAFVAKVPLSFASLAATSGDTGFVQRERAPPVDSPVVRSPDFGPLSPADEEHERRCDRAADVWPLATVISLLIPADRLLARSKPLGKHSPAHDLKTIAEEGDEPATADEEHDAVVDKFEPTVPASAPQEAKISGSVTIEPDASTGHVPRVVLKLNVPLSVPPLNDAEMVDAEVIDQLEVDKPSAPAPEQVPAKAQKRKAVRVKVKKEAVRSMPYRVSRHHGSGFYSEQNLVNLQWKGSGSRFDPVLIL
jgi:hypothetical protein